MKKIVDEIEKAAENLKNIVKKTPLEFNERLSKIYQAKIYFKREDQQPVRSYKIRGAYNILISLTNNERKMGVVTASAGNHAQGVAYSCNKLKIKGVIFYANNNSLNKKLIELNTLEMTGLKLNYLVKIMMKQH
ncbi:MAG: hypothetical protein KatS3mg092_0250 [Patescibacteria group bacterium]|nr:MAG: hypothetical protein KatS3mg092_0250 [Patescibacteria group bacterium]